MKHLCISAMFAASLCGSLAACTDKTDADYKSEIVTAMHDSIADDLDAMVVAGLNLQAAAPNRAWNATRDADAIRDMQNAWKRLRTSYEHIEGAIVALFPGIDRTLDGRYEELLADYHKLIGDPNQSDPNLFDATGVIGMHGIERILYSASIRQEVLDFEIQLPGYSPAAYPLTDDDAILFKSELVQGVIDETTDLRKQWSPDVIDISAAYRGLVGLMNEQKEKVDLAVTGEEESRYANITMFDLRCNLDGTQKVYNLFREWIKSKASGSDSDSTLLYNFSQLGTLYRNTSDTDNRDALPVAPPTWRQEGPTDANLATPFGTLWKHVRDQADPTRGGSVVFEMNRIGDLLGFPAFVESN